MADFDPHAHRSTLHRWGCLAMGTMLLVGCGGSERSEIADLARGFDFEAMSSTVVEMELGTYRIASALKERPRVGTAPNVTWVHIRFKLYGLVAPDNVKQVKMALTRRRGELDDTVLTVCRAAPIEELTDVRTAVLKSRIIDAVRPILGKDRIQQISFADTFTWEPI